MGVFELGLSWAIVFGKRAARARALLAEPAQAEAHFDKAPAEPATPTARDALAELTRAAPGSPRV